MNSNQNKLAFHFKDLSKIPTAFGFDLSTTTDIIKGCYSAIEDPYKKDLVFLLTKAIVKDCIYRISLSYFNEAGTEKNGKPSCLGYTSSGNLDSMPIPCRAVHILKRQGYDVSAIAEILNTNVMTVKGYLAGAVQYLNAA